MSGGNNALIISTNGGSSILSRFVITGRISPTNCAANGKISLIALSNTGRISFTRSIRGSPISARESISTGRTSSIAGCNASITSDTASIIGGRASSNNGNVSSISSAKSGINCSPNGTINTSRLLFNPSNTEPISSYFMSLICCIAPAVS